MAAPDCTGMQAAGGRVIVLPEHAMSKLPTLDL